MEKKLKKKSAPAHFSAEVEGADAPTGTFLNPKGSLGLNIKLLDLKENMMESRVKKESITQTKFFNDVWEILKDI